MLAVERLTVKNEYGGIMRFPPDCRHKDNYHGNVVTKLAMYEDTGLSPEEVAELVLLKDHEKLGGDTHCKE